MAHNEYMEEDIEGMEHVFGFYHRIIKFFCGYLF